MDPYDATVGTISGLWCYRVKAMQGEAVSRALIAGSGITYRHFTRDVDIALGNTVLLDRCS